LVRVGDEDAQNGAAAAKGNEGEREAGGTCASLGFAFGFGSDASDVMEPEMSRTTMQCKGRRLGLSLAVIVRQMSLPLAWHSRETSSQGAKSAEKLMLMLLSAACVDTNNPSSSRYFCPLALGPLAPQPAPRQRRAHPHSTHSHSLAEGKVAGVSDG
jgi:hypothetical protein